MQNKPTAALLLLALVLMTNPGVALEAARRLESSHLPRRASLLDARKSNPIDSELAKYDEEVERGAAA